MKRIIIHFEKEEGKMNWNKFWLLYNICAVVFMLTTAAFAASSDYIVKLDGWCAICCAIFAVIQWYIVEEEKRK